MRRINKKGIFIICSIILYIIASFFLIKYYNNFYFKVINPVFWGGLFAFSYAFFNEDYVNKKYRIDILTNMIITIIIFFIIYYLAGFISGFQKTPYDNSLKGILINLWTYGTVIFFQEYIRKTLVNRSGRNLRVTIITTIMFIAFELCKVLVSYDFSNFEKVFQFLFISLFPIIAKNLMATYVTYKADFLPSFIYRFVFEMYSFIVPFMPNFNWFLISVINIVLPVLITIKTYKLIESKDEKAVYRKSLKHNYVTVPILAIFLGISILVSGVFDYQMISIASNSMNPVFYRGDAVILKKLSKDEIKKIKIGDILVFESDNIIVVHRVIDKKITVNGSYLYETKGDNNNAPDRDLVEPESVIGRMEAGIKFIGYPSLWLQEWLLK